MWTQLHWVAGPWPGRLALAARPRGGDWLVDELRHWQAEGVDVVLSLLEPAEESDLNLGAESETASALGMRFLSFPVRDRQVPESELEMGRMLSRVEDELAAGRGVVIHCRQGVGRTGLLAACLLVGRGEEPADAIRRLTAVRGIAVPETAEQVRWIEQFAHDVAASRS